jgi:stearoyl-CoA desaturase (delta-9 desaturase)
VIVSLVVVLVVTLLVSQLAMLTTTLYLHRALSHRAVTMRPGLAFFFRVVTWMTTGIRPRQWVAVHRKHHAFTDVDGDPHSPRLLGWVNVQLRNVALYRVVANDRDQVARYARDVPADRWDRVLFDRAWLGLGLGITALIVVLGPWWGLLVAALHTGTYLALNAAVNAVTHTFGSRPYENTATNLQWVAWLTMGEGLHNNHHAASTSAKLAFNRGEVDPAWPFIATARSLRLLRVRHGMDTIRARVRAGAVAESERVAAPV